MKRRDERRRHRVFGKLRPPGAPSELRERTLEAVRATAAEPVEAAKSPASRGRSLTDRLWESRRLRIAWALLIVGLLGANLFLELDRRADLPAANRHATHHVAHGPGERITLLAARQTGLRGLLREHPDRHDEEPPPRTTRRML